MSFLCVISYYYQGPDCRGMHHAGVKSQAKLSCSKNKIRIFSQKKIALQRDRARRTVHGTTERAAALIIISAQDFPCSTLGFRPPRPPRVCLMLWSLDKVTRPLKLKLKAYIMSGCFYSCQLSSRAEIQSVLKRCRINRAA